MILLLECLAEAFQMPVARGCGRFVYARAGEQRPISAGKLEAAQIVGDAHAVKLLKIAL